MKISVIVCTYNRAKRLSSCLDSIEKAISHSALSDIEVIVVDNASTDNTQEVLNSWKDSSGLAVKVVFEPVQGVNAARNCGFRASLGDLIIYIDDDCVLEENYISKTLEYYAADNVPIMRFGAVHLGDTEDWPITVKTYPKSQIWDKNDKNTPYLRTGDIIGCSMIFPRQIIEKIGEFDELFSTKQVPGGNDTEFGFRVYLAGFQIEYCPDIIVRHFHGRQDIDAVRKLVRKYCVGGGAVYAKFLFSHPHIQAKLSPHKNQKLENTGSQDPRELEIGLLYSKEKVFFLIGFIRYFELKIKNLFKLHPEGT